MNPEELAEAMARAYRASLESKSAKWCHSCEVSTLEDACWICGSDELHHSRPGRVGAL